MFPNPFFFDGFSFYPSYLIDEKLIAKEKRKRVHATKPVKAQKALAGNGHSIKIKSPLTHSSEYSDDIEKNELLMEETENCRTCKFKKKLDLTI